MPESPPAPRDWRGGLPKLCAPSEGLLSDAIVNASEVVQSPEKLHILNALQPDEYAVAVTVIPAATFSSSPSPSPQTIPRPIDVALAAGVTSAACRACSLCSFVSATVSLLRSAWGNWRRFLASRA